jgi:hypothetical protein
MKNKFIHKFHPHRSKWDRVNSEQTLYYSIHLVTYQMQKKKKKKLGWCTSFLFVPMVDTRWSSVEWINSAYHTNSCLGFCLEISRDA